MTGIVPYQPLSTRVLIVAQLRSTRWCSLTGREKEKAQKPPAPVEMTRTAFRRTCHKARRVALTGLQAQAAPAAQVLQVSREARVSTRRLAPRVFLASLWKPLEGLGLSLEGVHLKTHAGNTRVALDT